MKHIFSFTLTVLMGCTLSLTCWSQRSDNVVDEVCTLMGTDSNPNLSTGNTYPAIAVPWGMNFWTPQTGKMGDGWTYTYDSNKIRGLKQTHQPSPWINDYGQFSLMPLTGHAVFNEDERASWFSHKAETARPYYYKVYLADYDITAELTPTNRAAVLRLNYPTGDSSFLVVDAFDKGSMVKVLPEKRQIIGYTTKNSGGCPDNFKNWFVIELDHPISFCQMYADGKPQRGNSAECNHAGAIVGFSTHKGQPVTVRVASSFISEEQAKQNLKEVAGRSFEQVCASARDEWNKQLSRFEIEDDNIDHIRTFYSCLYRCLLFPRRFYEVTNSGEIVHFSPYNGKVCRGYLYTDTGFWDTFRALFPFIDTFYPEEAAKMFQGWLNVYRESGFLPEWSSPGHRDCMVGNNSASVLANDYFMLTDFGKNTDSIDNSTRELLWQALTHGANARHPKISSTGRQGWQYYNQLGYIPCDVGINESVARTLEYAYDDWCIYQYGKSIGKSTAELEPYKQRTMNYRNVFDPETRLMRGRKSDGSFSSLFNPFKWGGDFTEGNSWHYTWSVFHDPEGLIRLMGGNEAFATKLDSLFILPPIFDASYYGYIIHEIREMQIMNFGNYAHGNQPVQHAIYLYDWCGQPWKAQYWVREVMERLYSATPDGYCGDEDNGQTSAWYVMSALGFYSVCPGSGEYALGSPLFKKVIIHHSNGKTTQINAPGNSRDNRFIGSVSIDGKPWTNNFLTVEQVSGGHTIEFHMQENHE
ncbi:MAG: GH92 family glycosyl hydrolase [Prevotella sp.]|jgi:predicted alpha-1,2-mannosidase